MKGPPNFKDNSYFLPKSHSVTLDDDNNSALHQSVEINVYFPEVAMICMQNKRKALVKYWKVAKQEF